ncbi:purine-nucleoside phosphorylase [Nocardiopsis rhodophaea]|uniref:Purine nucleoside phosphorylase n=1 Tax=Nocardiopsis rhodophaea TaxID=280238 RepID=A0ABP5F3E4_9ACTN
MMRSADAKELAAQAAEELKARSGADGYDAVVVLGSGWADASDYLGTPDIDLDVMDLPGFAAPTAAGHSTKVRSMWVGAKRVAVFLGRVHLYEGFDAMQVAHAVRTGVSAGADTVVLTGSAGSLRADFAVGQPIVVRDHINLTATSPLAGPDFVDLSNAYSERLRELARTSDATLAEGVYATVPGPQFQTPAELGMLRASGADLVGQSIALETIAAVEMGAEVLALAMVSNDAMGGVYEPFDQERALEAVRHRSPRLGELLNTILMRL